MKRVLIVYHRGSLSVTVYDDKGGKVADGETGVESVSIVGARRAVLSKGLEGVGLTLEFEGDVCLERKGGVLEVRACGASSGEE